MYHNSGGMVIEEQHQQPKAGVLLVRICEARGISLPQGAQVPSTTGPLPVLQQFDKNEILIDALGGDTSCPVYNYRANFDVSRNSKVSISIYLRQPPQLNNNNVLARASNDHFLGNITIQPNFSSVNLEEQIYNIVGGTGAMYVQLCYTPSQLSQQTISNDSFDLLKVIGKGSFGKVYVVRKKDTNRIYAMKVLRKSQIISRSEVTHTMAEKTVLAKVRNPFIVPLKFAFQSPNKLYLVLAFINGGELFHHLQIQGRFTEELSRFYAAELFCALECLHGFNVVYRDLKPENILIDYNGHIALCDFGLCKLNMTETERTNTFCGTPEYLAPELLLGKGYTKNVDWWTLGVLLYEMLTGLPPFYDENTNEMYRKILQQELKFPDDMSDSASSLLSGLLNRDPNARLGNKGTDEIKNHVFFKSIDWNKLMVKAVQPPFKPSVQNVYDTTNFDDEFTSEQPVESMTTAEDSQISKTMQEQFKGFTFNPDGVMTDSYQQNSTMSSSQQQQPYSRW
ncbi:hypothetical protein INT47_012421 [Mucor saturninus]|uniref:non-specific serine/threonine protein kinase n=1 Tax=Mucor saturninus TaxID=64648 RepID=A0A8H7QXL2_9FUNG|nr:hypothetical protein INT47_012421 [Mucor saturninus]